MAALPALVVVCQVANVYSAIDDEPEHPHRCCDCSLEIPRIWKSHRHPDDVFGQTFRVELNVLDSGKRVNGSEYPSLLGMGGRRHEPILVLQKVRLRSLSQFDPRLPVLAIFARREHRADEGALVQLLELILDNCSDERALVLLDISNLMVRQLAPLERAKRFERLRNTVPELRRQAPELKGVRTSQIIAEIITRETGQPISRASVDRVVAAGRKAQEVSQLVDEYEDSLIKGWKNEFRTQDGFSPATVKEIASRDERVQKQLLADYQREQLTPKQLDKQLHRESAKTEADVENTLDGIIRSLRTISARETEHGVHIDAYRVDYIRNQLDDLLKR